MMVAALNTTPPTLMYPVVALHCCTVLYCTVLYYTVLYCTVPTLMHPVVAGLLHGVPDTVHPAARGALHRTCRTTIMQTRKIFVENICSPMTRWPASMMAWLSGNEAHTNLFLSPAATEAWSPALLVLLPVRSAVRSLVDH